MKPKRGEAVWMIVNGEVALRYFVEYHSDSCIVSHEANLKPAYLAQSSTFFKTEADAIISLIDGVLNRMEETMGETRTRLRELCGQLVAVGPEA